MSRSRLESLYRRWLALRLAGGALLGAGLGLPLGAWMTEDRPSFLAFAGGAAALGGFAAWLRRERLDDVARHLDRVRPELEDSAELVTADPETLSGVARRQRELVAERIEAVDGRRILPFGALVRSLLTLALGAALAFGILVARERLEMVPSQEARTSSGPGSDDGGEEVEVREILHRIQPPRYTGLAATEAEGLAAQVPAGSDLAWRVAVAGPVRSALLETPEGIVPLEPAAPGVWGAQRRIHESSAVRLVLQDEREARYTSPWARLEVVPDRPPEIRIPSPDRLVERDPDDVGRLPLVIEIEDDYGIRSPVLVLTLALGAGEMVEFRERRQALPAGRGDDTNRRIETALDLAELGMEGGSELFLRVEASDDRRPDPQVGRSPTRIVRVRGGSGASADLAAGLPIVTPPDMFRSQRQIILDTEALLAERPRLAPEEVVRRSEAIGFDQRALRMRYGVLLGDEFVSGAVAGEAGHDEDHGPEAHEGGGLEEALGELPTGLVHTHDSAEMATFFPDAIRTALREALAAMWEAEKTLRSIEPEAALPHENRALELLQEIRRRSRVYVQRVGFDPPPIHPDEARLTGELDEILRPREHEEDATAEAPAAAVAYRLLRRGDGDREELLRALDEAGQTLADRALELPGVGLEGLGALSEVRNAVRADVAPPPEAVRTTLEALWSLVPPPDRRPVRRSGGEGR